MARASEAATLSGSPRENPRALRARSRATLVLAYAAVGVLLLVLLREAWTFVPIALARAAFPFDDNIWSDQPIMLQLWRFTQGEPFFRPMSLANSYDYGPAYLLVLSWIRALLHVPVTIVSFRFISMAITVLSIVPLVAFALILAKRSGITRAQRIPYAVVIVATVALAVATLTRSWTFDALHPDAALVLWIALGLWVYAKLVDRSLDAPVYSWVLAAIFVIAVLTKLNAVIVFPALVLGLLAARVITMRFAMALWVAFVAVTLLVLFALPHDMKLWTFLGPIRQPYENYRWPDIVRLIFGSKAYFGGLLIAAIVAIFALHRRNSLVRDEVRAMNRRDEFLRGLVVDGVVILSTAVASFGAYLKRGGGWHDLTILAFVCVPYVAVMFGRLAQPLGLRRTSLGLQIAMLATVAFTLFGFLAPGRPAPDSFDYYRMNAVRDEARAVCASNVPTLVTIFPSLFFGCKNVTYGLVISWGEVRNSFWDPQLMPTILDHDPGTPQIVWMQYAPVMPTPYRPWLYTNYRLIASVPAAFGYACECYASDAALQVWRRIGYSPK